MTKNKLFIFGIVFGILILIPLLIAMFENIKGNKVHNLGKVASFIIAVIILYIFYKNMNPVLYFIILIFAVLLFQ